MVEYQLLPHEATILSVYIYAYVYLYLADTFVQSNMQNVKTTLLLKTKNCKSQSLIIRTTANRNIDNTNRIHNDNRIQYGVHLITRQTDAFKYMYF